jgi:hypothetical protein
VHWVEEILFALEKSCERTNMKTKYLVLLEKLFSLDMPYADRQRMVVVSDESGGQQNGRSAIVSVGP